MKLSKPLKIYIFLLSIFLTFLLMAEVTGAKLISSFGYIMTFGVVPFPVTFVVTDILNEFYGKKIVRLTTYIGMLMVFLAYLLILIGLNIPAIAESPVTDAAFKQVFFNSGWVILGSITAYLIGQLIDIAIFHKLRILLKGKHIWLRATGSTIISQLFDSYIVIFVAFGIGNDMPLTKVSEISNTNFVYKMIIAILSTIFIYLGHGLIYRYLGKEDADLLRKNAEKG